MILFVYGVTCLEFPFLCDPKVSPLESNQMLQFFLCMSTYVSGGNKGWMDGKGQV